MAGSAARPGVETEITREKLIETELRNYRNQGEGLEKYAMAEHILEILMQEQEHQIDLATALGIEVPHLQKK